MNKLIILSLATLVACALAHPAVDVEELESQLALFEDDHVEAQDVKMAVFTDFCYKARDHSKVFLHGELNNAALKVYNAIFKSIEQISIDAIAAGTKEAEVGRKMIIDEEAARKFAAAAAAESVDSNDYSMEPMSIDGDIVDQDGEEQQPKSLAWRFFGGLANTFKAFLRLVADETWAHIARVREELKGENFQVIFEEACHKITKELVVQLRTEFQHSKEELGDAMNDEESKSELRAVNFENVNCVTTRRLVLASRLCHGVEKIGPIFYPFLDIFLDRA